MKLLSVLAETLFRDKLLRDAKLSKQLSIAWRHDHTIPKETAVALGPNPTPQAVAARWAAMLDQDLVQTLGEQYGRDPKFADWLTDLYVTGKADWEDISGEGIPFLSDWHYLVQAGHLDNQYRDLNKIKNIHKLQNILQQYQQQTAAHKKKRELDKIKETVREVVLIDNDKYKVSIPMNYGACRAFNMAGHQSTFCTGSSTGPTWYQRYSPNGPLVMVVDKANQFEPDGKWQFHAPTNQIVNSIQQNRSSMVSNAERFGRLFPGLMDQIVAAMKERRPELESGWHNMKNQIEEIQDKFRLAFKNPVDN